MLAAAAPGVTTADLDAVGRAVLRRPRRPLGAPARGRVPRRHLRERQRRGRPRHPVAVPGPARRRPGQRRRVRRARRLLGRHRRQRPGRPAESIDPVARRLLAATRQAQGEAMAAARAGRPLRHIGRAVERRARRRGFSVIANLCGHGVGGFLHEPPSVPSVEDPDDPRCCGRAWSWPSSRSCRPAPPWRSRTTTAGRCAPPTAACRPSSSTRSSSPRASPWSSPPSRDRPGRPVPSVTPRSRPGGTGLEPGVGQPGGGQLVEPVLDRHGFAPRIGCSSGRSRGNATVGSVEEVALAGEDHGQAQLVGPGDVASSRHRARRAG